MAERDYVGDLWGAFTGGLKQGISNYGGALGSREGIGGVQPAGIIDPAVQYREDSNGKLVNQSDGPGGSVGGMPIAYIVGGVALLAVVILLLVKR